MNGENKYRRKINEDEVELYDTEQCRVLARKDGAVLVECIEGVDSIELGSKDIDMAQGISELARNSMESRERENTPPYAKPIKPPKTGFDDD